MRRVVIGTRTSPLALAQVAEVRQALIRAGVPVQVDVREINTAGDRDRTTPLGALGGQGVFVKEIEAALLGGEIDLAVHSLKDLPSTDSPGLAIAAVPVRRDPRDAVHAPSGLTLASLPDGSAVATSSPRRAAQIRRTFPAIEVAEIRGNVDTRMRKVAEGAAAALIVAKAGMDRLNLGNRVTEVLDPDIMLPAVGQGAIACQVRVDDHELIETLRAIDDARARAETTAERAFLRAFGTGCSIPVAALGRVRDDGLWLDGLVISTDGSRAVREQLHGRPGDAEALGSLLAIRCRESDAAALLGIAPPTA